MNEENKSGKRKLTPFLAHEMLYDFVTDQLDPERKLAVEEFVAGDPESKKLIEAIRTGIKTSELISKIQLNQEVVKQIELSENFVSLSRKFSRWNVWPDSLRWSLIAVMVSVVCAGVIAVVPWRSMSIFKKTAILDRSTIEVAKIEPKSGSETSEQETESSVIAANDANQDASDEGSGDEEFSEDSAPPNAMAAKAEIQLAQNKKGQVAATPVPAPVSTPTKPIEPRPSVAATVPAQAPVSTSSATNTMIAAKSGDRKFVYRAFMTLKDLESINPKIVQQLKELGAEKAGEVELGWKRGTGRYFHFTMPESNDGKLLEALKVYGPVRISKDPHPRQMPAGVSRYILWIESTD